MQGEKGATGEKGDKGDSYSVVFKLNDVRVDVLNFDDVCEMESATFEADFFNQGVAVCVPQATMTCYDGEGNTLGSPIEIADNNNIVADGGNLYLSKNCKTIAVVGMDASGNVLVSQSIGVIRNTITYGLTKMSDTSATVLASDSTTNATFHLHYNLHYKAVKMVGTVAHEATIASIMATIEGAEKVTTVNGLEGTLSGDGTKSYDASNRPVSSLPVTVTLADGTVLYDSVPVTMEAGVAIDINNNLNQLSSTVQDNKKNISTITQKADEISLKVSAMDSYLRVLCYQADQSNNDTSKYISNATITPNGGQSTRLNNDSHRGFTYFFLNADNTITNAVEHNVYNDSTLCDTMAAELNSKRSTTGVLIIQSYDASSMTQALLNELEWWGLDASMVGTWTPERKAFAFIGEANLGRGRGWWAIGSGSDGIADAACHINNGHVVPQYNASDTAQKNSLLATGIDIDAHTVKFTGSQFFWRNNSGANVAYIDDKGNATFTGTVTASTINSSTINGTTITGGTISGSTITSTSADGKSTTKIEGGQVKTNNLVANGGSIGGFNISQYQIGSDSIKNADNFAKQKEMSLYRDYIYFNSPQRRALLGCLMSLGLQMMESLQTYSYNTVADYGIVASIRNYANLGFGSNAVALHLNGCIEGLAVQTEEASKDCTIGKYTGSFLINGAGTKYYLPDMEPWDEGHEIKIKRLVASPAGVKPQDDWTVILNAGKYNEYKNTIYLGAEATNPVSASSKDVGYSATDYNKVTWTVVEKDGMKLFHHEWQTCMSVDTGLVRTGIGIHSPGDAMTFIFHGSLTTTNYANCKGCWVQYKHPRDW